MHRGVNKSRQPARQPLTSFFWPSTFFKRRFLAWLVGSFIPSFLHLLVFALKPYSSQDFRVIIIFLVSFDALLNLTPPLEARLVLYCLTFLILSPSSIEDGGYSSQWENRWENFVSVRHTILRCLSLGNCWRD